LPRLPGPPLLFPKIDPALRFIKGGTAEYLNLSYSSHRSTHPLVRCPELSKLLHLKIEHLSPYQERVQSWVNLALKCGWIC